MLSNKFTALALAFACLKSVQAYQAQVAVDMCTGAANSPCSYTYDNDDGTSTVVNGFCAPNGYCADNGAYCAGSTPDEADLQCVNYCGTDNVCGGVGAYCNSQDPFEHNSNVIQCSNGYACPVNDPDPNDSDVIFGECTVAAAPSQMARIRSKAKRGQHNAGQLTQMERFKRAAAAVALPGDMKLE